MQQLAQLFDVRMIDPTTLRHIDKDIKVLLLIQPRPLSLRNEGTRESTLAATSTRVSPSSMRAEPSANLSAPVSMRRGRSASAARW